MKLSSKFLLINNAYGDCSHFVYKKTEKAERGI